MAWRTIYLVRHGQQDLAAPASDGLGPPLTQLGLDQAAAVAYRLGALEITFLHCSTLRRAAQTAEVIARQFPELHLQGSKKLHECMPAVPWASPALEKIGAERLEEGRRHAEEAFSSYFKISRRQDKQEIVVCHGNIIRYFICRVLEIPPEVWGSMIVHHCGISEVRIGETGSMSLVSFNDTGHIPDGMLSE